MKHSVVFILFVRVAVSEIGLLCLCLWLNTSCTLVSILFIFAIISSLVIIFPLWGIITQPEQQTNKKTAQWAVKFGFYVSHPKPWRRVMILDLFWRRPTLPWLKPKYHRRYAVSLSGSGWNRGWLPLNNHQNKSSEHHKLSWITEYSLDDAAHHCGNFGNDI